VFGIQDGMPSMQMIEEGLVNDFPSCAGTVASPTGHLAGLVTALLRSAGGMGENTFSVRPSTFALPA